MENVNSVVNDSIQNPMPGFSSSFRLTYHEKKNKVRRPRLNETNIDPALIADRLDESSGTPALNRAQSVASYSRLIKNWDFDAASQSRISN